MAIPVKAESSSLVVDAALPPTPVEWGHTRVTVTGKNGQGEEIPLTDFSGTAWPGIILLPGATGLDMPPFALFSDESPNLDGSIYRNARATSREIAIPVFIYGIDRQTVNAIKRQLFQALNPKRGYCVLKFSEGDGQVRILNAYYKGGMEGAEGEDISGFTWTKYGLQFTAMDPWYYPDRSEVARWTFGDGEPLVSSTRSFLPLQITSGVMGGPGSAVLITNPGDIEAWPVWSLVGPIKSFELKGPDGALIKASAPTDGSDLIPAGRTLTIDTRPGHKTVKDDQGLNYWSKLDTNPQFWSVDSGETEATVTVVAGTGSASVTLSFSPRYASYV